MLRALRKKHGGDNKNEKHNEAAKWLMRFSKVVPNGPSFPYRRDSALDHIFSPTPQSPIRWRRPCSSPLATRDTPVFVNEINGNYSSRMDLLGDDHIVAGSHLFMRRQMKSVKAHRILQNSNGMDMNNNTKPGHNETVLSDAEISKLEYDYTKRYFRDPTPHAFQRNLIVTQKPVVEKQNGLPPAVFLPRKTFDNVTIHTEIDLDSTNSSLPNSDQSKKDRVGTNCIQDGFPPAVFLKRKTLDETIQLNDELNSTFSSVHSGPSQQKQFNADGTQDKVPPPVFLVRKAFDETIHIDKELNSTLSSLSYHELLQQEQFDTDDIEARRAFDVTIQVDDDLNSTITPLPESDPGSKQKIIRTSRNSMFYFPESSRVECYVCGNISLPGEIVRYRKNKFICNDCAAEVAELENQASN